jgi:NADPH:quinone reductase-like Zn-dependent oxidoreductase
MEFAGVVDVVGEACADSGFRPGDLVVGLVNPRRTEGGAYSTFICLPPTSLAIRPASIPEPEAATLPMNGVTAIMAIESAAVSPGGTVLVTGGAGALGGYAIQLARAAGLIVIAHGRTGDKETMQELGATHIVSTDDALPERVRELFPQGVDALIDTARLGDPAEAAVKEGGVVVHVLPTPGDDNPRLQHKVVSVSKRIGDKSALDRVVAWAKDGKLTPRVATILPMAEAAHAHELVEKGGLRGRVVLDLRS